MRVCAAVATAETGVGWTQRPHILFAFAVLRVDVRGESDDDGDAVPADGLYPEDDRIPSVREYAANVEVNVNTCMRAYDWLCSQDIIFTKRGLGYFVATGARETILALRKKEFFEDFLPELAQKMQTLGISNEELINALNK